MKIRSRASIARAVLFTFASLSCVWGGVTGQGLTPNLDWVSVALSSASVVCTVVATAKRVGDPRWPHSGEVSVKTCNLETKHRDVQRCVGELVPVCRPSPEVDMVSGRARQHFSLKQGERPRKDVQNTSASNVFCSEHEWGDCTAGNVLEGKIGWKHLITGQRINVMPCINGGRVSVVSHLVAELPPCNVLPIGTHRYGCCLHPLAKGYERSLDGFETSFSDIPLLIGGPEQPASENDNEQIKDSLDALEIAPVPPKTFVRSVGYVVLLLAVISAAEGLIFLFDGREALGALLVLLGLIAIFCGLSCITLSAPFFALSRGGAYALSLHLST